jgi:uncharacterized membrane protein
MHSPQREWAFLGSSHGFSLLLKRNCSISPQGMILVFALLALATLGIATGFALAGAWLVLPFAGLEEVAEGRALRRLELNSGALRVRHVPERARVLLTCANSGEIEIGRHLDAEARVALADKLKKTLSL